MTLFIEFETTYPTGDLSKKRKMRTNTRLKLRKKCVMIGSSILADDAGIQNEKNIGQIAM